MELGARTASRPHQKSGSAQYEPERAAVSAIATASNPRLVTTATMGNMPHADAVSRFGTDGKGTTRVAVSLTAMAFSITSAISGLGSRGYRGRHRVMIRRHSGRGAPTPPQPAVKVRREWSACHSILNDACQPRHVPDLAAVSCIVATPGSRAARSAVRLPTVCHHIQEKRYANGPTAMPRRYECVSSPG